MNTLGVSGSISSDRLQHLNGEQKIHVAVCGPIGVGKSTLVKAMGPELECERPDIGVAVSQESPDDEMLGRYIAEPKRFALVFQTMKLNGTERRRLNLQTLCKYDRVKFTVIEREIEENRVFALANTAFGNISRQDYRDWYCNEWLNLEARLDPLPRPTLWIFLFATQEVADKRKGLRNRHGEDGYTEDYIDTLYDTYFHWVLRMLNDGNRVLVLNWMRFGTSTDVWSKVGDFQCNRLSLPAVKYTYSDDQFLDQYSDSLKRPKAMVLRHGPTVQRLENLGHLPTRRAAQTEVFKLLSEGVMLQVEYE